MKKKTIAGLAALGAVLGIATVAGIVTANKKKQLRIASNKKKELMPKRNVYFAGGGISALAGAYYLINDCNVPADSIHIFEESDNMGGFIRTGDSDTGYTYVPTKLLSLKNYANLMDMLKNVPSANIPELSVKEEIISFMNNGLKTDSSRLISSEKTILPESFGLSKKSAKTVKNLIAENDYNISNVSVEDYFKDVPEFFESNLWPIISTSYLIPRTSSAVELKRILISVAGEAEELFTLSNLVTDDDGLEKTVVDALVKYLSSLSVQMHTNCSVKDVDFHDGTNKISAVHLCDNGTTKTYYLNTNDLCFVTNGSLYENATLGDYNEPAAITGSLPDSSLLWQRMSEKRAGIGNPDVFYSSDESAIVSFAITTKSSKLVQSLKNITNSTEKICILTTFRDSPWCLTVSDIRQNDDGIYTVCGYGTETNKIGKYIDKKLKDACGAEILFELVKYLKLENDWEEIIDGVVNVIPCLLPFAAAPSLPHVESDKPNTIKDKTVNFAFIGQFVRLGGGISSSNEYAVRAARDAVYKLTDTNKNSASPTKAGMLLNKKLFGALRK